MYNEIIDYLLLPMVFFIGIMASFEDIKTHKIRNKWIKLGLIYGLVVYLFFIFWNIFGEQISLFYYDKILELNPDDPRPIFSIAYKYFVSVFINSALSLIIGYMLWKYGKISAGDVKLFFVFSWLLPLKYYWQSYLPLFPSVALVINIFLVVLLYLVVQSISYLIGSLEEFKRITSFKLDKKHYPTIKKKLIGIISSLVWVLAVIVSLQTIANPIMNIFNFNVLFLQPYIFVALILFRQLAQNLFNNKKYFIFITIYLLFFITYGYFTNSELTVSIILISLRITLVFILAFNIIKALLDFYNKRVGLTKIKVARLKKGMCLGKKQALEIRNWSKNKDFPFESGLDNNNLKTVREWAKDNDIQEVMVYNLFAFAPWIFVGVLVTILLQGSLLLKIMDLIR